MGESLIFEYLLELRALTNGGIDPIQESFAKSLLLQEASTRLSNTGYAALITEMFRTLPVIDEDQAA